MEGKANYPTLKEYTAEKNDTVVSNKIKLVTAVSLIILKFENNIFYKYIQACPYHNHSQSTRGKKEAINSPPKNFYRLVQHVEMHQVPVSLFQ